jgi:hypothetical protein
MSKRRSQTDSDLSAAATAMGRKGGPARAKALAHEQDRRSPCCMSTWRGGGRRTSHRSDRYSHIGEVSMRSPGGDEPRTLERYGTNVANRGK